MLGGRIPDAGGKLWFDARVILRRRNFVTKMNFASIVIFLVAILGFWWARRRFFRREQSTSRLRGGLAPAGTLFAVVDVCLLVSSRGASSEAFFIGTVFMALSISVFWASIFSFGDNAPRIAHTPGDVGDINERGPYRFVRHPFYLSYILCWCGASVYVAEGWQAFPALIIALTMAWMYYRTACAEESDLLSSAMGVRYGDYKARTGMFFPKLKLPLRDR
jgi:protein-S-isoprenylcysteine O-methyltransferase Ste14